MTRIISLLILFFVLAPSVDAVGGKKTRTIIRHIILDEGRPEPLSADPVIGESDKEEGYTELTFNEGYGYVTVRITDSAGNVVDQLVLNTDVQRYAVLSLPDPNETYELSIEGSEYLGYGTIY